MKWDLIKFAMAASMLASSATAETVIKFATFAPVGSAYHDILLDMQSDWREISGGEVELRLYAGGVAGDERDMVRKMRVGQLHAATLTSGGLPDIDPDFRAFQVPMMFDEIAEFDHVMREMRSTLDGLLSRRGFRGLGWADAGWLHFFSRSPIVLPADLEPQRIFVWSGADRFVEAWRDCGYRPVQLDATDIHTALQSKMIDAVTAPPLAALSTQWFAHIPEMSTLRWVPLMAVLTITEQAWGKLPKRLRPALAKAAERAATRLRTEVRADSDMAVEIMRKHGLKVNAVSPSNVDVWRAAVGECFGPMIGGYIDGALVRKIERALASYRARG